MKILMTSGPTQEPLDSVRYLTNFSSGKTGASLADFFIKRGHEVIFLYGASSKIPLEKCRALKFKTFSDLDSSLKNILNEEPVDLIVHLSAVGDYSIKEIRQGKKSYSNGTQGKIDSGDEDLIVTFKKNFKIVNRLRDYARRNHPKIIGFKLTDSADQNLWLKAVQKLYLDNSLDLIVHNDLRDIDEKTDLHGFRIYDKSLNSFFCETVDILGDKLLEKVGKTL